MNTAPYPQSPAYQKLMARVYRLGQMQMHLRQIDHTYFNILRRSRVLYQQALDARQWPADALGVPRPQRTREVDDVAWEMPPRRWGLGSGYEFGSLG